jgi:hypothetical protein
MNQEQDTIPKGLGLKKLTNSMYPCHLRQHQPRYNIIKSTDYDVDHAVERMLPNGQDTDHPCLHNQNRLEPSSQAYKGSAIDT